MKRLSLLFISFVICLLAFSSCEKNGGGKIEFTNMTGVDFYDCQIWFRNSPEGELIMYEEVGNVLMGESAKVNKQGSYCYVYAKDGRGNLVMTKTKNAFDGMTFSKFDLL